MAEADLLFALGWEESESVIGDYIRYVANGGLTAYKTIFQTGAKAGEPVYVHFVNGVFTAERLCPLVGLGDEEARVLYSAYSVHDLNKLVESNKTSFNTLAVKETIQRELERIGVPQFFPRYLDYLEDITLLVRSHSGHYHTAAEGLVRSHNPYRLDRDRLDQVLVPLMKGLDLLELSHSLEERRHKESFLAYLNSITAQQYTFVTHQLAEQRGLLTNLAHNRVSDYLERQYGLVPLLIYPEGIAYLAEKDRLPLLSRDDVAVIGRDVAAAAARTSRGNFARFIRSGNQGIKVSKECLELGVPFDEIFGVVYNEVARKVTGRRFKVEDMAAKARRDLTSKLWDEKHTAQYPSIQALLDRPALFPSSQDGMGAGELLRSYYIFLSDHLRQEVRNPWQYLYAWLGISPEQGAVYDQLDPRYHRPYVIAGDLELSIDLLFERIREDGCRLLPGEDNADDSADYGALTQYVNNVLSFSDSAERPVDFQAALQEYMVRQHRQCCYCGSEFPADSWMAAQVPENITVQSFSNRLPGGWAREPKKNVCHICRAQFTLEKFVHQSVRGLKTVYIHLYPYSFYPDVFLQSLREEVRNLLATDTNVVFPLGDDAFQQALELGQIKLPVRSRNQAGKPYVNGIVLPRYSETIGNVLVFPLNCPGETDGEQFLFALQSTLLLQRYFGCKAMLTDSAVPVLGKEDFADLFVDNVAPSFAGLLPHNNLDRPALQDLWDDFLALHRLKRELYNPEREESPLLSLVLALNRDRLHVYHVADRLLEHKVSQGRSTDSNLRTWRSIALAKRMLPGLRRLARGGMQLRQLEDLAKMAWMEHIRGSSLARNSLMKPLDMLLEGLEKKPEAFGRDTLRAQLTEDIFRHLEAIAPEQYRPGRNKRDKVKAYVDTFFDGVLGEAYRGNDKKLLTSAKPLRSAYLFYLREQIPTNVREEATDDDSNSVC